MNQNKKSIVLLFFILCYSLSVVAQIQKTKGKLTRIDGKTYISKNDKLCEIDDKLVLAKLKKGRTLPKTEAKNVNHIAMDNYAISVPDGIDIENYILMLKETDCFDFVEYNCIYSPCLTANDTYYYNQWHLSAINANTAWDLTTGSPSIKVAVIDDGIELNHEDLSYGNDNYSNLSTTDNVDYISSTDHTPLTSHGTEVAGVLGAKTNNNYVGVAGVAGGHGCSGATIVSYRTNYTASQITNAIYNAVINKGVKVINLSIEGGYNESLSNALDFAFTYGVTVVCASGNGASSSISFPASHQYTIAVGGININNEVVNSNYGSGLDLVAPGSGIWTTCKNSDGNYKSDSGTSLAAPQVAGVVALMLSVNPFLTPSQIKNIITNTCTKLSGFVYNVYGWESHVGYGLLNAYGAVCAAFTIFGPTIPGSSSVYSILNLPSCCNVTWTYTPKSGTSLPSGSFITNSPATNQCTINNSSKQYINGTLMATITKSGTTIATLEKEIRSGDGFSATCSQPSGLVVPVSGNVTSNSSTLVTFMDNAAFSVKKSSNGSYPVTITSPYFSNATITHTSITGLSWNKSGNTITISYPANNLLDPPLVVTGVSTTDYRVYRFTIYSQVDILLQLTATVSGRDLLLNLSASEESIKNASTEALQSLAEELAEKEWTITVVSATTGKKVFSQEAKGSSFTIDTTGWESGIYVIKANVGDRELIQKVLVK